MTDDVIVLSDESEILLRQVHPTQITADGKPDSSAFQAKAAHGFLLSTRREAIGAMQAHEDWITTHASAGTWGIKVGDVRAVDLTAFDDSAQEGTPEGHASIDYRGVTDGQARQKARKLRDWSHARGRLHP